MIFEIKHRFTGAVLFSMETESLKLCVEAAVKSGASLDYASLSGASLSGASLNGASLVGASLDHASLDYASLDHASLNGASLNGASLVGASLDYASLDHASLNGASLNGASLKGAKNAEYAIACTRILPDGELIVWKKAEGKIVKLRVPADAKRSSAFGRKCRAEFVDVLDIEGAQEVTTNGCGSGVDTVYRVGERVTADGWCEDFTKECAQGIHFFITKLEAENF